MLNSCLFNFLTNLYCMYYTQNPVINMCAQLDYNHLNNTNLAIPGSIFFCLFYIFLCVTSFVGIVAKDLYLCEQERIVTSGGSKSQASCQRERRTTSIKERCQKVEIQSIVRGIRVMTNYANSLKTRLVTKESLIKSNIYKICSYFLFY